MMDKTASRKFMPFMSTITCLLLVFLSVLEVHSFKASFNYRPPSRTGLLLPLSAENGISTSEKDRSGRYVMNRDDWLQKAIELQPRCVIGPKEVLVYDTSLRDGTQGESVSASCDDKLKIVRRLCKFQVDYIEAGWPGSNPKDAEFFDRAKTQLTEEERSTLVAFGSTRRKNAKAIDDKQVNALLESEAPTICLVCKAHSWQVEEILKTTREENLNMIRDTVSHLVAQGRAVMVDLEHFFDGFKLDSDYAMECAEVAADAGAECLVMCDTNGGTMPWEVEDITKKVVRYFDHHVTIGIHAHNDCAMAVANSVTAANAGVGLVQGTINGIGERTGNADLCAIIPSLAFHVDSKMTCKSNLSDLTKLSRFVDEVLNRTPNQAAPFVGTSAFAHKGGLHVAAMERSPLSYQHIQPELVGNEKRVLISELSGRQNIMGIFKELGVDWGEGNSDRAKAILEHVKRLENKGYTFEGAEASVHLMVLHASSSYCPPFRILDYSTHVYDTHVDSASRAMVTQARATGGQKGSTEFGAKARANVKVRTINNDPNSEEFFLDTLEVSDGKGPVDALAKALMRALLPSHPYLEGIELVDYKVRILDPQSATRAATRVMIDFRDTQNDRTWTTVAVDRNVISASLNALVDGFEYALVEHADSCMLCDDDIFY